MPLAEDRGIFKGVLQNQFKIAPTWILFYNVKPK